MSEYHKPTMGEDGKRPLLTEGELHDACFHDAATVVVAYVLGCGLRDCRLTDDGHEWPTRVSSVDLDWTRKEIPREEALETIATIYETGSMAVARLHGRPPHVICGLVRTDLCLYFSTTETQLILDNPLVWSVIEALAKFIEDNYEDDGCYGALGTDCREPGEDSAALKLIKGMGLFPGYAGWRPDDGDDGGGAMSLLQLSCAAKPKPHRQEKRQWQTNSRRSPNGRPILRRSNAGTAAIWSSAPGRPKHTCRSTRARPTRSSTMRRPREAQRSTRLSGHPGGSWRHKAKRVLPKIERPRESR